LKTKKHNFISQRLKGVKKLVILGIGSELMQDDAAGIIVTQNLIKKYGEGNINFKIYIGYTTPENYSKNITDFNPDHIIIVDSANLNKHPGSIINLPVQAINDFTLGTHKLSLVMMIKFINKVIKCKFAVIAIQYKSIEFNGKMTKEVKAGVKQATDLLSGIIDSVRYSN
jgi:hydrogenase maturation protease HycI